MLAWQISAELAWLPNQVVEVAPAYGLDPEVRAALHRDAVRLCKCASTSLGSFTCCCASFELNWKWCWCLKSHSYMLLHALYI